MTQDNGLFLHWTRELNEGQYLATQPCVDHQTGRRYILIQAWGPEPPIPMQWTLTQDRDTNELILAEVIR